MPRPKSVSYAYEWLYGQVSARTFMVRLPVWPLQRSEQGNGQHNADDQGQHGHPGVQQPRDKTITSPTQLDGRVITHRDARKSLMLRHVDTRRRGLTSNIRQHFTNRIDD